MEIEIVNPEYTELVSNLYDCLTCNNEDLKDKHRLDLIMLLQIKGRRFRTPEIIGRVSECFINCGIQINLVNITEPIRQIQKDRDKETIGYNHKARYMAAVITLKEIVI